MHKNIDEMHIIVVFCKKIFFFRQRYDLFWDIPKKKLPKRTAIYYRGLELVERQRIRLFWSHPSGAVFFGILFLMIL